MLLLALFAFLAGIVTVLSPCTLPVLPILLSVSASKGRERPLGIILGLVVSFTFFTLAFTFLVQSLGLSPTILRWIATVIIAFFGLILLFPKLDDLFAHYTNSIANVGTKVQSIAGHTQTGFWGGVLVGAAMGLVWTPCAGPILAAIAALVAFHSITAKVVILTLLYSLGAAIPMLLIMYGGKKAIESSKILATHTETIRKVFGVLTIATALAIAMGWDIAFEQLYLNKLPILEIENTDFVKQKLRQIKNNATTIPQHGNLVLNKENTKGDELPKLAGVPEFVGIDKWINTNPLTMQSLRGKVVLIDFWTYSCINCLRTLPYLNKLYADYGDKGFIVVGVHTPEFEFEKDPHNVEQAVKRNGVKYPVALDNKYETWNAFGNEYWPAHYLVDQQGIVRQVHFGEGGYMETENAIRKLLNLEPIVGKEIVKTNLPITPETYLGYLRADRYVPSIMLIKDMSHHYTYNEEVGKNQIGIKGDWFVGPEYIKTEGNNNTLTLNFLATRVYLVLSGKSPSPITVDLDGKPLPKEFYTDDMNSDGKIFIKEDRKYDIVNLHGQYGRHLITLHIPKGISVYAFSFGDGR